MANPETIGVVGVGELGSKLELQAKKAGFNVVSFDPFQYKIAKRGINPWLRTSRDEPLSVRTETTQGVFDQSALVHWTAHPEHALQANITPKDNTVLFLHSSVMAESIRVAKHLEEYGLALGQIAIVHCAMNYQLGVSVASDHGNHEIAMEHIKSLGLNPVLLTSNEHDRIMWDTQGLALRISERERQMLAAHDLGILPPSAERVRAVIDTNNTRWTATTKKSLDSNPFNKRRSGDTDSLLDE